MASWMGSDFTNDDLVRESSLLEDYAYSLAGRSEDPVGWLIRFEAKPGVAGLWNRFELVLSDDGQTPLRGRYYDRKDRHARTMYWELSTSGQKKPVSLGWGVGMSITLGRNRYSARSRR